MYVALNISFAGMIMLHRENLDIHIYPNAGNAVADYRDYALAVGSETASKH
jgi:aromatic ring-cleaving dioxygenase